MGIGDRIKSIAEARGIDLTDFASLVGVPYRTLQNYVYGKREPGAEYVAKICIRSGVDGHWLLTGEGEMYPIPPGRAVADQDTASRPSASDPISPAQDSHQRRLSALGQLLAALDPESRETILADCFARAATAQQLAELRQAVRALEAERPAKDA